MANITRLQSLDLPELEPYLTMRRPIGHRERGIFIAEGEKVVRRLVESELKIVSILLTEEWLVEYSPLLERRIVEAGIFVAGKRLLEEIVGYKLHQGIMAIGRVPEKADQFDFEKKSDEQYLFVAVDGVANSENMGVIVRNCAAFGVDALIVGETSCDPYLRRSVRNSMGTIFSLPIVRSTKLVTTIESMRREHGVRVVAANPRDGSVDVAKADLSGDVCVVFGSEGEGISPQVLSVCDTMVEIPMQRGVDSINVGSSVGVILYECARQRSIGKRERSRVIH